MSPVLLFTVLVAALVGLVPVWRLRVAGWPANALLTAWIVFAVVVFAAVRAPVAARWLVPILVLAYVAPFVAGPERLTRVLRARTSTRPRPMIDVTPPHGDRDDAPPPRDGGAPS
jgi:hypothetical protein